MPWQDVCPYVCHTPVLCQNNYTYPPFFFQQRVVPPSYPTPNGMAIFRQEPPNKGDECKGGMKKSRFSTDISLYLGIHARQSHSYYRRRIGNRPQAFECHQFQWLEWPLTQILRSRYYSTPNNSKMVQDAAIYNGKSYMVYRSAPFSVTLNNS